jgi:hypothetical protein
MKISEVRDLALKAVDELSGSQGQILQLKKTENDGWEADVEVLEVNEFIKSLNLPTKGTVKDRTVYSLLFDSNREITSCSKFPYGDWVARRVLAEQD